MKKWQILHKENITKENIVDVLLANRGIVSPEEKKLFLNPSLESVNLENVDINKTQVKKTIKRIEKAIKNKEQIVVYGDYDVDGITGSAILWETLYGLGANVIPYIPHRIDEGYGLSQIGISNILSSHIAKASLDKNMPDVKLIITVDNGIVANEAVNFANENGIDVIVTDHHVSGSDKAHTLPKAYSIVHTTKLCGAGVAYVLSKELLKYFGNKEEDDVHLELAALGTIADLVPLIDANRAVVKHGLEKLSRTKRPGLLALFREAGCDATAIGVYAVGHIIGPRLNATGRLESAMDSLRLLCTRDSKRADMLAAKLGIINKDRQIIMFEAAKHAVEKVKSQKSKVKSILIVSHDSYQEGVIGLVAGKLVEEFYRPAIVIAKREKVSKGSVRSISGFNIIEFLRSRSELFVNVGGHPMAAGFSVETEKITQLQETLEELAEELISEVTLKRILKIDAEIPFSIISDALYQKIQQLTPFGMANPEPVFASRKIEVMDKRTIGRDGKHIKLLLRQDQGSIFEAVGFGLAESSETVKKSDMIDVAYTIDENTWNGNVKLQLKLRDIRKVVR